MLAGPSNAGLADPGQSTPISVHQVTVRLLTTVSDMGDLAMLKFLAGACEAVKDAFMRAERKLDKDHRAERESREETETGAGDGT
jgi:hypothetical protein